MGRTESNGREIEMQMGEEKSSKFLNTEQCIIDIGSDTIDRVDLTNLNLTEMYDLF